MVEPTEAQLQGMEVARFAPDEPMGIERIVALAERGVDPDTIGKVVDLFVRVNGIQAEQAYNEAIHAAQAELQTIQIPCRGKVTVSRDGTKRPYPLLEDIQKVVHPILTKYGLAASFDTDVRDKTFVEILRISHVMGVTRETRTFLPLDTTGSKNAVQGVGSTDSYGMRYNYIKALALVRYLYDDDGASAGTAYSADVETVSEEQAANLKAVYDEVRAKVDPAGFQNYFGVPPDALSDLPAERYSEALEMLERKR